MSNPYTEKAIAVDILLVSLILLDAVGIVIIPWWIYIMLAVLSMLFTGSRIIYERDMVRDVVDEVLYEMETDSDDME